MWLLSVCLLLAGVALCANADRYDDDNNLDANNEQLTSNVNILPKQIFNDGKPFYVKKDPVSGTLNFNAKTTPAEPIDDTAALQLPSNGADVKHDISVKTSTQNIHDYLNLPVKYSSSKFVYPLVSSSYANLKYQGNNKNYISNHKYESSTSKSVPATANNYKKHKTPYPTKVHHALSSSTVPKKVSSSTTTTTTITTTIAPASTTTMTNNFESASGQSVRPNVNNDLSSSALRPSYTTIGHKDRVNNTITRNSTLSTMRPIVVSSENWLRKENVTTSSKINVTAKPSGSGTANEKEQNGEDSMNIGDLFSFFFNGEDNEAKEDHREDATKKATAATTRFPSSTTQRPHNRYSTIDRTQDASITPTTTITTTTTAKSPSSTIVVNTKPPTTATTTTTTRIPFPFIAKQEQRPSTQLPSASPFIQNQIIQNQLPFNGHAVNFHPPASSEMTSIVVAPGSHTASFVATGQLSAGNNFDRRPVADASYRPAPTNDIVTGLSGTKGHVSDIYAQKPASSTNNIVVAPGSQTASVVATSQFSMGAGHPQIFVDSENDESHVNEQQIKNTMNAINVYDTITLSTQRPQGFAIQTTTGRPSTQSPQTSSEPNRIRFPMEQTETAPVMMTLQQQQQQQQLLQQQQNQNNSVKFPSIENNNVADSPVAATHVKLDTRNEIYDRNNYKQIVKQQFNPNRVIFERPQSQTSLAENQLPSAQVPPFNPNIHTPQFNFKRPAFVQYPRKNLTLPNILPQFRPSVDTVNQLRAGLMPRPQQFLYGGPNMRYKPVMHYPYGAIRTKAPLLMATGGHLPHSPIDQPHNRRHFEIYQGNMNRIFDRPLPQHMLHRNIERNTQPQIVPVAVVAANSVIEDQQFDETNAKIAVNAKAAVESNNETPKVEPVTTLQQIQQQRLQQKKTSHTIVDAVGAASDKSVNLDAAKPNNSQLYVVYPVQETSSPTKIQHALPNKATPPRNFPYALEKSQRFILNAHPSNEFDEKSDQIYERPEIAAESDDGAEDREHPIAIAYSPTESSRPQPYDTYSERIPYDNAQRIDVDASIDAINGQTFMAPFIPSVNLENTQSTNNGWSVVTPSAIAHHDNDVEATELRNNQISTSLSIQNDGSASASASASGSDSGSDYSATSSETTNVTDAPTVESTTRKFDISNFQPELQGGFRPIFKTAATPTEKPERSDSSIDALVYDDE